MKSSPFLLSARHLLWLLALLFLLLLSSLAVTGIVRRGDAAAQNTALWQDVSSATLAGVSGTRLVTPINARRLRLDQDAMLALLAQAPLEGSRAADAAQTTLPIPLPGGGFARFRTEEAPIMEPGLAAQFPAFKTYLARGLDDATATARLDWTPAGFHAVIFSAGGTVYIDPYVMGDTRYYLSYFKQDLRGGDQNWQCFVKGSGVAKPGAGLSAPYVLSGATLRTYRLAMAATGEYTAFHGGTVPGAMAAIVTTVNRVTGIFEREVGVRMVLVANNNSIIYTNPATDPYTNGDPNALLNENQANLDSVIGNANYDIGHVFSTGGGGLAGLGVVCDNSAKAYGETGSSSPTGDAFDVDYVAHEIGHQFGGNHTFNNNANGSCSGNREASAAYEPGSGTTIMAYAGICGGENIQPNSNDYFHVKSLEEILATIAGAGGACAVATNTGNNAPTVNAGAPYTIPQQTPFILTATGSDPDADTLSYTWEQYDLGAASPPSTDNGNRPIFRSFQGTTDPSRTFPQLSDILNNTSTLGESLPTTTRALNFRVTARDNRAGGGGVQDAAVTINVRSDSGPFLVTAPNTAVAWPAFSTQTVTWDVANTAASPVNCAQVNIKLSTDGGNSFPTTLLAGTPNDGSAQVTLPGVLATQARIKVEAAGNIFFDISNSNFMIVCPTITAGAPLPQGTAGVPYNQSLTASPAGINYSFALEGGSSLPPNLSLAANGAITGTPLVVGSFNFNVVVTGFGGACSNTVPVALTIVCPTITVGTPLPQGTAGTPYNQSLTASPAGGNYSFALAGGSSLPPNLSLAANGAITGTPLLAGTFNFNVVVTGFGGACSNTVPVALTIVCPVINLSPATLPDATANIAYAQVVTASPAGGNYSFAVTSGLLPAGLTLLGNGSFSGAPVQAGVFNFRITATGFGPCSGFRDYTLIVVCPGITVNPASLPGGTVGTPYSQTVSGVPGVSYNYSVASGALPLGLTLNASTGVISGTPAATGSYSFRVTATIDGCSGFRDYTVAITCPAISFATASPLPPGQAGIAYSQPLAVTPAGSYTFSLAAGTLLSGLTLNPATGVISGTPGATGSTTFTVKAQMANGCSATQSYALTIGCPAVVVSPATLPAGTIGTAYAQTIVASPAGGNYTFAVSGSLPAGLNLNTSTGVLSGTPTANGSYAFTVTAIGFGGCTGNQSYTVVIGGGGCPTVTLPASLPSGSVGQLYNHSVVASPSGAYTYTFTGNLPPGVTLYANIGLVFGYPAANGSYTFTVTATDANNCTASQTYTVQIGAGSVTTLNDFSGDRKSDFVLWRPAQAQWLIVDSATAAAQTAQWGRAGDKAVAGDYDGDGKADLAAFGKDGHWRVRFSGDGSTLDKVWGLGSDVPVPGDYDGDGKTDLAVWRGTESAWYIQRSSDGQTQTVSWGASYAPYLDVAVPGDYDGDGKTDVAVFRSSTGHWYIQRSSDGAVVDKHWGLGTDMAVPGDYDGDGQTDIAIWRGSEGAWYIIRSSDNAIESKVWGTSEAPYFDAPAVGDYDGDGKADVTVWRISEGRWYVRQSSDGATRVVTATLRQSPDLN